MKEKRPIRVIFVCHGNICRSPMAEFVLKDMVRREGLEKEYEIASAATSYEEIGSPPHRETARILAVHGIPCKGKRAVKLVREDYDRYDIIVCMDTYNVINSMKIFGGDPYGKIRKLLSYTGEDGDVADPWYTGDFDRTYEDVVHGCRALLAATEVSRR